MFSFFKKSVVSQPDTALAPDFGMLGTEKQQKLVDCTHKLDAILQKKESASNNGACRVCPRPLRLYASALSRWYRSKYVRAHLSGCIAL